MKTKRLPVPIQSQEDLDRAWSRTNLSEGSGKWSGMEDIGDEEGQHIWVPQCSYLGGSGIMLSSDGERSGEDCYFVSELIRLYREGKVKFAEEAR